MPRDNSSTLKDLLTQLSSIDEKQVLKSLEQIKMNGNASFIEPLLEKILQTDSQEIKAAIGSIFKDLSDSSVLPELIRCLNDARFSSVHTFLMNAVWNSKLNFSPYVHLLAEKAIAGDFEMALECLTVLENLEGPFDESSLLEAQIQLSSAGKNSEIDEDKRYFLSEMAKIVKNMDRSMR